MTPCKIQTVEGNHNLGHFGEHFLRCVVVRVRYVPICRAFRTCPCGGSPAYHVGVTNERCCPEPGRLVANLS